jgi:hypothetical protein
MAAAPSNLNPTLPSATPSGNNPLINITSVPSVTAPTINRITTAIIIIIMILVCVVLAGFDENLGRILVVFMSGVFMIWLLGPGEGLIGDWLGKL